MPLISVMKRIFHIFAVLFVSAAFLASCDGKESSLEEPPMLSGAPQGIPLTATLAPKGGFETKSISTGKDDDNNEIISATWKAGEKIAIYYQKTDDSFATAIASIESVDSGTGTATITATLPDAKDGCLAKFIFPASLATRWGDIDGNQLMLEQNGLLRTGLKNISKNFDAATATGTISVNGGGATVGGPIMMENQVCICKMTLTFYDPFDTQSGQSAVNQKTQAGSNLKIIVGNERIYTITSPFTNDDQMTERPFQTGDVIYVAMLPTVSQSVTVISDRFGTTSESVTLEAGKFYRNLPIKLDYTGIRDLSYGSITAHHGDIIIQSNDSQNSNTITIEDNATVTIRDISIKGAHVGIFCLGSAAIILEGQNTIDTQDRSIHIDGADNLLTIRGNGCLNVSSQESAAIGSESGTGNTCNILIDGGSIVATGGDWSAAIGGGAGCGCRNITITSGVTSLTAIKGNSAPYSIGPGWKANPSYGSITIGGTVYFNSGSFENGGDTYLAQSPLVYKPAP